jgi:hypothetical protein
VLGEEYKMNNYPVNQKNHMQNVSYVEISNNIEFPIVDITHPLFVSSIDENKYHLSNIKSAKTIRLIKKLPYFMKKSFTKTSDMDNSYLTGMRTMIYKLGPNLAKGIKLGFRDRWAVKQDNFMGLRIRLRDVCQFQAEILLSLLQENPSKNLCFFNIAGGPSSDSINTIFLIQDRKPELLKNRKIEIAILDIDSYGPDFARRCVDVLKTPGKRFHGLDIAVNIIPYNWNDPGALSDILKERADWIQICTSEGGLFEYGSEDEITQNLNQLYINSVESMRIVGTIILDKENVSPGYLGFAELTGIQVRFIGLDRLKAILSGTNWALDDIREIDNIFIVFTLRKVQKN